MYFENPTLTVFKYCTILYEEYKHIEHNLSQFSLGSRQYTPETSPIFRDIYSFHCAGIYHRSTLTSRATHTSACGKHTVCSCCLYLYLMACCCGCCCWPLYCYFVLLAASYSTIEAICKIKFSDSPQRRTHDRLSAWTQSNAQHTNTYIVRT